MTRMTQPVRTRLSAGKCADRHENEVVSAQTDTVTDTAALVTVVALVTLHTVALHATRDEPVAFRAAGNGVPCLCQCGSRNDRTWPGQNAITGGAVADFDNLFDAAIARADETIRGYMGIVSHHDIR